ncbi:MAG: molybdopterin molybdotransferase MoeA [Dehalococcoidia bacterium]|nr:molybdopterin molybdotransferase MoeA [Dehalococcoidia bacterium]
MKTVEEALEKILATVHVLGPEEKPLLDCLGQVLAVDVTSTIDIPPHDNSAMDGYAVRSLDLISASENKPVILKVIGEIAAGYIAQEKVTAGSAMRIMTGAPLPEGADAVVQFENTDEQERKSRNEEMHCIGINSPVSKGLNVRYRGEDIYTGRSVIKKGTILRAAEIGVMASLGIACISVIRRPVVSVLSTGDELCDVNAPLTEGKIYDSNTFSIAASVLSCGGIPKVIGIGRDTFKSLRLKINRGLNADMLITSGGVSKGDYDVVKDVLANMGEIAFWTVRMKPGKPLAFGTIKKSNKGGIREIPHLGLPGNPASSMITFEQFARPAIFKMMGKKNFQRPFLEAVIDGSIINSDGRRIYARVLVSRTGSGYKASLTGPQGSGILTSMARANGLAIIPEDCPGVRSGDKVTVQLIDYERGLI